MTNLRVISGAILVLICIGAGLAIWVGDRQAAREVLADDVANSFLRLERAIGYAGFIHHFKNHVLRPGEPIYARLALEDYDNASSELSRLKGLIEDTTLDADLLALQQALDRYRKAVDVIRSAHARGETIEEVDRLVRIPDDDAALRLTSLQGRVDRFLTEQGKGGLVLLNASLGLTAALLAGLLIAGGYLIQQRQALERAAFAQQRRELEQEKAHAERMEAVVSELERSNLDLDEFAYIASHDLKEPLRGIGINAHFLLREDLPEKAMERALRMSELSGRMEQLISDLLFFSRLGRSDSARVEVQPGKVIELIRSELAEWLTEHGAEIVEIGTIPSLKAERLKVKTVLQNLIVNGVKYNNSEEKVVEIGFTRRVEVNGRVFSDAIFVKDNGIGIRERHRDKVFRIFTRLNKLSDYDSGGGTGTGTGSGLAFVRKILEEHGGAIDFTSKPGEGATFYLTLPLAASMS